MVGGGAKSDAVKEPVPRKGVFGMNKCQPVGVHAPKGHVGPHIAVHQIGGTKEGDKDHADCVKHGPVEGIKETRIGEFVVGFVRELVKRGRHEMFQQVHDVLNAILDGQTQKDPGPFDTSLKGVVWRWHQIEHPCERKVASQQSKSLGLGQVRR